MHLAQILSQVSKNMLSISQNNTLLQINILYFKISLARDMHKSLKNIFEELNVCLLLYHT